MNTSELIELAIDREKYYATLRLEGIDGLVASLNMLAVHDLVPVIRDGKYEYTLLTNGDDDVIVITKLQKESAPS